MIGVNGAGVRNSAEHAVSRRQTRRRVWASLGSTSATAMLLVGRPALADAVHLPAHNRSVRLLQTLQGGLRQLERRLHEPAAFSTLALARLYHLV
jgi:hypothetical protein